MSRILSLTIVKASLRSTLFRSSIRSCATASASSSSAPNLSYPPPANADKLFSPKILSLVDEISKLNLLEVVDLNECLKKTLKIEAMPIAMAGGFAAPAAKPADDAEEDAPKAVKSAFTVKLVKFDDTKKVALIKEIKNIVEGMNLVQAKKFVESAPQVLKSGVSKDEAEALKKSLEGLGAVVELE